MRRRYKYIPVLFFIGLFLAACLLVVWYYRPNTAVISPDLDMEVYNAFDEEHHNSNTNMIYCNGSFYLVYEASIIHWATTASEIVIRRSPDGKNFEEIVEVLDYPNEDIRDPKFANFNGTLFVYALPNKIHIIPINIPYKTVYSYSTDGDNWTTFADIKGDAADGWKLWMPKTFDNKTWYVTAHKSGGKVALFNSTDGVTWNMVSMIHEGDAASESSLEFLPNGSLICTSRAEVTGFIFGDFRAHTIISAANPPFTTWRKQVSYVTKLDGPAIFLNPVDNRTYALGRFEPEVRGVFTSTGGFFNKKRSSIFLLNEEDGLTWLTDLPSSGDTSYFGYVVKDGYVYMSYYTSDTTRDFIWFMGQIAPSYIKIAKVNLTSLSELADNPSLMPVEGFAFDSIFLIPVYISIVIILIVRKKRKKSKRKV